MGSTCGSPHLLCSQLKPLCVPCVAACSQRGRRWRTACSACVATCRYRPALCTAGLLSARQQTNQHAAARLHIRVTERPSAALKGNRGACGTAGCCAALGALLSVAGLLLGWSELLSTAKETPAGSQCLSRCFSPVTP